MGILEGGVQLEQAVNRRKPIVQTTCQVANPRGEEQLSGVERIAREIPGLEAKKFAVFSGEKGAGREKIVGRDDTVRAVGVQRNRAL